MPLTIGAFDKLKAAMRAVPGSGLSLLTEITSKVVPGEPERHYATPGKIYRDVMNAHATRQQMVTSYAAFRAMADRFDPSDAKANAETLQGRVPTRENNQVPRDDWDRLLRPGGLLDSNVQDLFESFGDGMTVYFIRHLTAQERLKRIEITYAGGTQPQVVSMHW